MSKQAAFETLVKMRRLTVPQQGRYGIAPLNDAGMPGTLSDILRVFSAIEPTKNRKPNGQYGFGFDKYTDVLSDSPITIAGKMGGEWRNYNQQVIVQIGICNFRCWYCYVDYELLSGRKVLYLTADAIVSQFLEQRQHAKSEGKEWNVLRISGGEPFLAPDLILDCLRIIKQLHLDRDICIKTETNLSPLIKVNDQPLAEEWADFQELAQYRNLIVHPTLHGISQESLRLNANADPELLDVLFEALKTLIDHRIDIYPSFGSNTVPVGDVRYFWGRLKALNKNLPLRIAVRPFRFDYESIVERAHGNRKIQIFDHVELVKTWDDLLRDEYGVGYAEVPRHAVSLY